MTKKYHMLPAMLLLISFALCGCAGLLPQQPVTTQPVTTAPPTEPPVTVPPTEPVNYESINYLKTLYPDDNTVTPADYYLIDVLFIDELIYKVVWSVDVGEDVLTLNPREDGTVFVDINEQCPEDTPYTLIASIATAEGYRLTHSWTHTIPKGKDMVTIVEEAYALKKGQRLSYPVTLTGKIRSIDKEWSEDYQSISVTIIVADCDNRPIRCYSLSGEGIENLQKGDTITVHGILQNYSNRIEFDAGCRLVPQIETNEENETNEE